MQRTITQIVCDGCNAVTTSPAVERRGYWGRHYCLCPACVARGLELAPNRVPCGVDAVGYVVRHVRPATTNERRSS